MLFSSKFVYKIILLSFVLLFGIFTYILLKPLNNTTDILIDVKQGYGLNLVIDELTSKGLIDNPLLTKIFFRITNPSNKIMAGEYLVSNKDNVLNLFKRLSEGHVNYRKIRLKEGSSFNELATLIMDNPYIKVDDDFLDQKQIKAYLGIKYKSLEGIFYPDTYNFIKDDHYLEILKRSHLKHKDIISELWKNRTNGLPFTNSYEALILASIVEKEGIEKKEIAGVFIRRLNLNMKLQSDPTIIFALGDNFKGNIKRIHIKMKHPYNTYYIKGLPPGPIGLVSEESIEAVLNPSEGEALYFVSKGDGTHQFSVTLEEHNEAVRKYQLKK